MTDLRDRRAEVNRNAIRDAVVDFLATEHPATLNMAAIAERAGMSVRTLYRYFPTKQALIDDVATIQSDRAAEMVPDGRDRAYTAPDFLVALWRDFAADLLGVRAQHSSPLGDEIRLHRLHDARREIGGRIDRAMPSTPAEDRAELTDVLILLTSSSAFLELHSRLGYEPDRAAALAWWAVSALQRQFETDGGMP